MPRIRTIKPEFPQSESIGRLSRDARLLFIQLWTVVDDEGRARAASRMLASLLYPYDDDAPSLIDGWLGELEHNEMIRRYQVEGSSYLDIPHWAKHQKIDHKSQSKLPPFDDGEPILASPREPSRSLAPDLDLGPGPRTKEEDQESSLRSDLSETSSDATAPKRQKSKYPDEFEQFWKAYPTDPLQSKKQAFDAWKRLPVDDRTTAILSVPAFREHCRKDPTYRPVHACRYLAQRRFDGFVNGKPNGVGPPRALSEAERAAWVRQQMELERATG